MATSGLELKSSTTTKKNGCSMSKTQNIIWSQIVLQLRIRVFLSVISSLCAIVRAVTPVRWIVESGCKSDSNQGGLTDDIRLLTGSSFLLLFNVL